jgi:mono/diheme cytochrome c family protein
MSSKNTKEDQSPGKAQIADQKMRRTLDALMVLVCLVMLVKGCRQSDGPDQTTALDKNSAAEPAGQNHAQRSPSGTVPNREEGGTPAPQQAQLTKAQLDQGKKIYVQNCLVCHQPNGEGLAGVFPPLAKSDFLMADKERSIRIVIQGQTGEIVVNGVRYNGIMPPVPIKDEQVAQVLTYVRNSWGNSGEPVTVEEVKKVRAEIGGTLAVSH